MPDSFKSTPATSVDSEADPLTRDSNDHSDESTAQWNYVLATQRLFDHNHDGMA